MALALLAVAGGLPWLLGTAFFLARWRAVRPDPAGAATLVLPVTGARGLARLFACLAAQTLRPSRLLVVVESAEDPAHAEALRLAPAMPFTVELLVAGTAPGRGQKATSLIAASRRLGAPAHPVVLLDADIAPSPDWLALLVAPLLAGRAEVVTGGRWHVLPAAGAGLRRHLMVWLERSIMLALRLPARRLIWGGSAGFAPAAFQALDLPRTLDAALADDLALSRAAERLGLRVLVRRALLVPTPAEGDDAAAWGFMLRQLRLLRIERPGDWAILALLLLAEAAGAFLLAAALAGGAGAAALVGLLALVLMGALRALAHDLAARRLGLPDRGRNRLVQALLGGLRPLAAPLVLPLLARSAVGRRIRWRHVEYRYGRGGRPEVLWRGAPG